MKTFTEVINEERGRFPGNVQTAIDKFVVKSQGYEGEPQYETGITPYVALKKKSNADSHIAFKDLQGLAKMKFIRGIESTKHWLYIYI